jgi:hypothetical protein
MSLALSQLLPPYNITFPAAGYASIVVNSSYIGGHVRQFGNLSFSRIFDAGHLVPSYQPETAFTVFTRIIRGVDLSMGHNVDSSTFSTVGVSDSSVYRNQVPEEQVKSTCWISDVKGTCTEDERTAIDRGEGDVSHGVWTLNTNPGNQEAPLLAQSSRIAEKSGETMTMTSTVPLTGVYVATGTPAITSTAKAKSEAARVGCGFAGGFTIILYWALGYGIAI